MATKLKPRRWITPLVCLLFGHGRVARDPFVACWRCGLLLQDRRDRRRQIERHATEPRMVNYNAQAALESVKRASIKAIQEASVKAIAEVEKRQRNGRGWR